MDNETNINSESPRSNAVSLYRTDGPMDDFPVLKAFQQYIDAEQNKARKRLVTLCLFFGAMICVIIAVFMVMLRDISQRNQMLNDRLVEYVIKDRDRAPLVVNPPAATVASTAAPANAAATEAALKAMTETLVALQKQIAERPTPKTTTTPAAAPAVDSAESEIARKERLAIARIKKEREQLAEERRKLAEERERKHLEEVEKHRRRLYPEYYEKQENTTAEVQKKAVNTAPKAQPAPAKPEATQPARREISAEDIADILREADLETDDADDDKPEKKKFDDVEDAIEYFGEEEYEIPVEVKGSSAKWRVPLD